MVWQGKHGGVMKGADCVVCVEEIKVSYLPSMTLNNLIWSFTEPKQNHKDKGAEINTKRKQIREAMGRKYNSKRNLSGSLTVQD